MGCEHDGETDDQALAVGGLDEHFSPGDFVVAVHLVLLFDLLVLAEGEDVVRVAFVVMKLLDDLERFV